MKKFSLLFFLTISIVFAAQGQFVMRGAFTINGLLPDESYDGKLVYLKVPDHDMMDYLIMDSAYVVKNKFTLEGVSQKPRPGFIIFSEKQPNLPLGSVVILEQGSIDLLVGHQGVVSGTEKNDEFQLYSEEQSTIINQIYDLGINNTESKKYGELMEELKTSTYNYLKKNIKNGIGEFFILNSSNHLDTHQIIELLQESKPEFQQNPYIQYWLTDLLSVQPSVGDVYPDITLKDMNGNEVAISDYISKNKYILIDFWASWCGPCIKETPTLAEAYQKFKDKGFEIIGISLDESELQWSQAVERLGISWPQISDLGGWRGKAARTYKVTSIPLTFLLDHEGKVIEKNLRGEMLLYKLEEIFHNPEIN